MTQLPNFDQTPSSPELSIPGVAVVLGGTWFDQSNPVLIHGSFLADGKFWVQCDGQPLSWIVVIVIGRDLPSVWSRPVRELPNLAPRRVVPMAQPGPSFRVGGHFNLDLKEHLGLPNLPGRYWLFVSMGDHLTDRIAFEIH